MSGFAENCRLNIMSMDYSGLSLKMLKISSHISSSNLMKQAGIFQDLEDLYDFQPNGYGSHFLFQKEAKILYRQVFIAINIPCKFGDNIFIND